MNAEKFFRPDSIGFSSSLAGASLTLAVLAGMASASNIIPSGQAIVDTWVGERLHVIDGEDNTVRESNISLTRMQYELSRDLDVIMVSDSSDAHYADGVAFRF